MEVTRWIVMWLRCNDGEMHYRGSSPLNSINPDRPHHTVELIGEAYGGCVPPWVKDACLVAGGHDLVEWHRMVAAFDERLRVLCA